MMMEDDMSATHLANKLWNSGVPLSGNESVADLRALLRKIVGAQKKSEDTETDKHLQQLNEGGAVQKTDVCVAEIIQNQKAMECDLMFHDNKFVQMEEEMRRLRLEMQAMREQLALLQAEGGLSSTGRRFELNMLDGICAKFTGAEDQNINVWLRDFEKALCLFSCSNAEKSIALRAMLGGVAKRFAEIKGIFVYGRLKECLVAEYGGSLTHAKVSRQLAGRLMKADETSKQYIMDMELLASYGEIPEAELIDFILQGLKKNSVLGAAGLTVTTLSGLKQMANRLEVQQVVNNARPKQQEMESIRCYNCLNYGHYQGECEMPKRPPNSCFVCSKVRHTRHNYPKKKSGRGLAVGTLTTIEDKDEVKFENNVSISFCNDRGLDTDTGSPASFIQEKSSCGCDRKN